jgi:hypothetical protein
MTRWKIADTYYNTIQKMVLYRHVGRAFWDIVWIEESNGGPVKGGIKEGSYQRKEHGYEFINAKEYTPTSVDIHNAILALFGEL